MRCFYHGDVDAVAICKSCGHALCHECCIDVGTSAACRNRCEGDVEALNLWLQRSRTSFDKAGKMYIWMGCMLLIPALLMLVGGLMSLKSKDFSYWSFIYPAFIGLFAAICIVYGRRFRAKK